MDIFSIERIEEISRSWGALWPLTTSLLDLGLGFHEYRPSSTLFTQVDCIICRKILTAFKNFTSTSFCKLGNWPDIFVSSPCRSHKKLITAAFGQLHYPRSTMEDVAYAVVRLPRLVVLIQAGFFGPEQHYRFSTKSIMLIEAPEVDVNEVCIRPPLDPNWVSVDLVRSWKHHCDLNHSKREHSLLPLCHRIVGGILFDVRPVWLVDTVNKCLVRAQGHELAYVALSYVWGGVDMFKTLRGNINLVKQPGFLAESNAEVRIPDTIRDAMGWVQVLGEQYLWVDSLCIVQDGDEETEEEMSKMAGIYANATVTIVAAQGADAAYGLRGLKGISQPRNIGFKRRNVSLGNNMIELYQEPELDHQVSFVLGRTMLQDIVPNRWSERGWTFQESVFSRRILMFNGDRVRWECPRDEFVEWDIPALQYNLLTRVELKGPKGGLSKMQNWARGQVFDLPETRELIHRYNIRQFTYPQDILWGFSGLATVLRHSFFGPFIGGLPSGLFNISLLWTPAWFKDSESTVRPQRNPRFESAITPRRRVSYPGQSKADVCLPSWSWAGWECGIDDNFCAEAEYFWLAEDWHWNHWRWDPLKLMFKEEEKRLRGARGKPSTWNPDRGETSIYDICISGSKWRCKMTPDMTNHRDKGIPVEDLSLECMAAYLLDEQRPCPPGWSRHAVAESHNGYRLHPHQKFFYTHRSLPGPGYYKHYEFAFPLPIGLEPDTKSPAMLFTPFITCHTRKAKLFIAAIDRNRYRATLCDQSGSWAGTLIANLPFDEETRMSVPVLEDDRCNIEKPENVDANSIFTVTTKLSPLDLVEISRGVLMTQNVGLESSGHLRTFCSPTCPEYWSVVLSGHYSYYNVLWVEWVDGVAYRKGVGKIWKNAWEALERELITLVLG